MFTYKFFLTLIPWVFGFIFFPKLTFFFFIFFALVYLHHFIFRYRFSFCEKDLLMFFGLPGSGKSTLLAEIVRQIVLKKCKDGSLSILPYTNFPVKGAYKVQRQDIGRVDFTTETQKAVLLLDEASTVYFKRNAMNKIKDKSGKMVNEFSDAENIFHSMHRHYHTMEILFAQSWDGVDLRLRELSTGLYYVQPARIRNFIKIRKIVKIFKIREEDGQPCDGYEFERFSSRYVWAPRCWKLFDTYDAPELPRAFQESWYDDTSEYGA